MIAHVVCIRLKGDPVSEAGYAALCESSARVGNSFDVDATDAIGPDELKDGFNIKWSYPWDQSEQCPLSGLTLHPYKTRNRLARIGCALSHLAIWGACVDSQKPAMVLEDDALFVRRFDIKAGAHPFLAFSLNDPRGATRKARLYHERIQAQAGEIVDAPWVDDSQDAPQGLPGASAYLIHHWLARDLVDRAEVFGMWPNDAFLCKQLWPGKLGCVREYITKVSGRTSTLA